MCVAAVGCTAALQDALRKRLSLCLGADLLQFTQLRMEDCHGGLPGGPPGGLPGGLPEGCHGGLPGGAAWRTTWWRCSAAAVRLASKTLLTLVSACGGRPSKVASSARSASVQDTSLNRRAQRTQVLGRGWAGKRRIDCLPLMRLRVACCLYFGMAVRMSGSKSRVARQPESIAFIASVRSTEWTCAGHSRRGRASNPAWPGSSNRIKTRERFLRHGAAGNFLLCIAKRRRVMAAKALALCRRVPSLSAKAWGRAACVAAWKSTASSAQVQPCLAGSCRGGSGQRRRL